MGGNLGDNQDGGFFRQQGMMSEINVTPFVDVLLVLLIILMVAAPFAVAGVNVKLPSTRAKQASLGGDPLILSVTADGKFYLGKIQVGSKDLVTKLKAAKGPEKEASLYIRADGHVPYARVMDAMAAAQNAGIHRIGMLGEASASEKSR